MERKETILQNCYRLLQNVLQEAFQMPTLYFQYPYKDIRKIDQGLRAVVWTNYDDRNTKIMFTDSQQEYRMLIIKSNLGFYNILITFGMESNPDFISIGPFREEEISVNYFTQILREAHIAPAQMQGMKQIYEKMPCVQLETVMNVTKHIISSYIPEFKEVVPELKQFSEQKRAVEINSQLLEDFSVEYSEKYQQYLFVFLENLKTGHFLKAQKALNTFLQELKLMNKRNMREYKLVLQSINNYCQMYLLQTNIHPLHIMKQSVSLRIKIDTITSHTMLERMSNEICRKYCLLIKNYANPECSKLTKDVISYIQLHMEEELSLSYLASLYKKNASVLSSTFSREMGMSLTSFIQQTRIQAAIRLFNTTNMSVADVATAVGYLDFSYFSKLFSKHVGCSPREYKSKSTV